MFRMGFAVGTLSAPPKSHPTSVYSYTKHLGELNFEGIEFPVRVRDIDKFEKANVDIAVNVISGQRQ